MTEQERFERFIRPRVSMNHMTKSSYTDSYVLEEMNRLWAAWQAAQQKEGFVLVPVEPTDEYLAAMAIAVAAVDGVEYLKRGKLKQRQLRNRVRCYFEAMIQAAREDE